MVEITLAKSSTWPAGSALELVVGSEGAASLAASDPVGGTVYHRVRVGDAQAIKLQAMVDQVAHEATFPVAVRVVTPAGDVAVTETTMVLRRPPHAPQDFTLAASLTPGTFTIGWDVSDDF
jgi:hypothetical protein